ncbi:Diaminopimelate epimerase [Buchnera aphidicola (Tuberolachnus salignus)]|uniref:Diaminopimelate epimerase n=2 Tax=Buchnera aphidicola TaxID=9 RepID=A0A160SZG0_BUCTT|nr:Diaminopimelate epimerase [Buchnera aphidicola (Tuberolachnus salignus)]
MLKFSKMHGLGNDFMVVDTINQSFFFSKKLIKKWSNRTRGIGFDQLLILEPSNCVQFDFFYRIFNSNGLEVEQCGNGARCIGLYCLLNNLFCKKKIILKTQKNFLFLKILQHNIIEVNMGIPCFSPKDVFYNSSKKKLYYNVKILNNIYTMSIVSLGNPHCVILVSDLKNFPVQTVGSMLSKHNDFLYGVNVGFMQIINSKIIHLRVYERNTGETESCGSGACAAVAIGIRNKLLNSRVKVYLPGGILTISWIGEGKCLYMQGSATHVYDGKLLY